MEKKNSAPQNVSADSSVNVLTIQDGDYIYIQSKSNPEMFIYLDKEGCRQLGELMKEHELL